MRILASTMLLVMRGVRADDSTDYPDSCYYNQWGSGICGDMCIYGRGDKCYCQSYTDSFRPYDTDEHCCLNPGGEGCSTDRYGDGHCSEGRKLSKSSACNTTMGPRCYNSYQHSKYIGRKSHYTCPDTCVPWEEMCQGVSWCEGDHQVCGPDLRCPPLHYEGEFWPAIYSSLVPGHHYCIDNSSITDDGKFDSIDRSDETRVSQSPLDLNITSFTPCNDTNGFYIESGLMCGTNCRWSSRWCLDGGNWNWQLATCDTGSRKIRTNNPTLCRDPRVWANVSCSEYYRDGRVMKYGLRCSGQNMRCVYPWYTWHRGLTQSSGWATQCPDKSDQVFNSSLTCRQHLQQNIDLYTQRFCNENYSDYQSEPICLSSNKYELLSGKDKSYTDPHSCQSSCSVPSPDCLACSNSSYFPCHKSGQCVHPDLKCDGHPQCKSGEDEELSMCKDKFLKMKIIHPLATFRCPSLFYENMFILATPLNNKSECWNGEDEIVTGDNSTMILVISAIFMILVYIALKYSGLAKKMLSADNQNIVSRVQSDQIHQNILDYTILKSYSENHEQNEIIAKTNIHILNSLHTQKVDDNTSMCKLFYELEQEIHEYDESEIHLCLHKKMGPKVVENILDSGEPGCTAGFIEGFENCVGRRLIMELQDKITSSLIIKEIIGTTFGVIKLMAKYVDLFKDTALSIIMLHAVGSFQSIWEYKTNFSSVIVMTMFLSVLIPLLFSTLNLIINRKKVINESNFSKSRKYLTMTVCLIASFLNPIILDAYYQELKEDVRKLSENHDIRVMTTLRKCRNIKNQIVTFHKTELGQSILFLRSFLQFDENSNISNHPLFVGFEVIVQVTVTILVLLLNRTKTPTTGGLEIIFDEGNTWDAQTILAVSVTWSLLSTIKMQTSITILDKGFCPTTSKLVVLAWASFATLRRILSLVTMFIPSMGLCSLLHHWQWEQVPFKFAEKVRPGGKISLFGLNETVLWSQLHRWTDGTPPSYNQYTLLTLQETFNALMVVSIFQFIAIIIAKCCISKDFRDEEHKTNKVIHTLENLNFASPFRDWDDGDFSVQQFRERATAVRSEMIWTQTINFIATLLMMVPLWYTGMYSITNI